MRAILSTALGLALFGLSAAILAPANAGEVYQWKDANGVTHYSETPPPKGAYKQRSISSGGQAQAPVTTASAAPAADPQCDTARANLALLQSEKQLQLDTNGDGKPETPMSANERANQLELAQATLKANCTAVAAQP